ncbi:putative receptor-like protein kinase [Acorus gramineus]|uniref:Receptor-like protein kinase n=1 Tax=Acorus gramineus TaxID=55184 RepID=A0AAV9BAA7_ACOGR|nr:putative receptor-like protein kinase [Acorus gramineus]
MYVLLFFFGLRILFYPFYKKLKDSLLFGEPQNQTSAAGDMERGTSAPPPVEEPLNLEVGGDPRRFSKDEIARLMSLSGFSVIREGQFSDVLLAKFPDESMVVIKIYHRINQASFEEELEILLRLSHPNVLRPIGYCNERVGVLVFKYFPKGNLHDHLHNQSTNFPWHHRTSIAYKVACTIYFLHENHTIHGDINSSHILLDSQLNPKLCDFHSSVRFDPQQQNLNSGVVPTTKTDVYSFGILLLELLSGHDQVDVIDDSMAAGEMVDARLKGKLDSDEVVAMSSVAKMCMLEESSERPSMLDVLTFMEDRLPSAKVATVE